MLGQLADTNRRLQEIQATARDLGEMLNDPELDLASKATIRREFEATMRERMELIERLASLRAELEGLRADPLFPRRGD